MITLESLTASLAESDPFAGIDRLVRAELAIGRTTGSIHNELLPFVRSVRKQLGFSPDSDEALLGALDALAGNCHQDCRYQDAIATGPIGRFVEHSQPAARS